MSQQAVTVQDIFTEELRAGLADGTIMLIDVREAHEFQAGHINGAILMPLSAFKADELPTAAGKRIIFSCRSGVRSIQALMIAQQAGLDITQHYKPGFNGWLQEGGEST